MIGKHNDLGHLDGGSLFGPLQSRILNRTHGCVFPSDVRRPGYLLLCCGYVLRFTTICNYVQLFAAIYNYLILCATICYCVQLFATICYYLQLFASV